MMLWGFLLFGLTLRFVDLTMMEFKGDEYAATVLAYRNVFGPAFAQTGISSSTGILHPPFFIYILSFPVLFSASPIALTLWIALINAAGIIVLYSFLRRAFSASIALDVAALVSSMPWAIIYSRKIWNVDVLFPFLMGFYWMLFSLLERYRSWKVYLCFVLLAVTTQFHMSAWFIPLPLILFFCSVRPRFCWKIIRDVVIGMAMFLGIYLPYLRYQAHDRFSAFQRLLLGHPLHVGDVKNILWSFWISSGQKFEYLLGSTYGLFSQETGISLACSVFSVFFALSVVGVFSAFLVFLIKSRCFTDISRMEPSQKLLTLFLLIFICIHACYVIANVPSYPHYSIVFYPIIPLFFVLFLRKFVGSLSRFGNLLASFVILVVIGANLFFCSRFLVFVHRHASSIKGDYGTPYTLTRGDWEKRLQIELDALGTGMHP